jgi:hypothetical protein
MESSGHNFTELTSALKRARQQIAQYEVEISEFQASSRELEKELELELEDGEKKQKELQVELEKYKNESQDWKKKYVDLQKEAAATQGSLLKEVGSLQTAHREAVKKLHEIEMENDDMERHERITRSTLEEIEHKYHTALEEIAMLEADVAGKDDLRTELQHAKEELRDTREELQLTQMKVAKVPTGSTEKPLRPLRVPQPTQPPVTPAKQTANTLPRLTSSKSLRKIHGMLDQMRNLESRVASFKSSLPIPKTPPSSGGTKTGKSSPGSPLIESSSSSIPKLVGKGDSRGDDELGGTKALDNRFPHPPGHFSSHGTNSNLNHRNLPSTPSGARVSSYSQQLEPIKGSPNMSPLSTVRTSKENELPKHVRKGSLSPKKSQTLKEANRPGSAFSALHNRPSFGHGRFV